MRYSIFSFLILLTFSFIACNSSNKKDVLADLEPSSKQYKQELARQLKMSSAHEFTFTLNQYLKINGKDYLDINIRGQNLRAGCLVLIDNWNKLEAIKQSSGMGYGGAELKNLQLNIVNAHTDPIFIYKDLDKVSD